MVFLEEEKLLTGFRYTASQIKSQSPQPAAAVFLPLLT